ncbi:dienelactone hydrolase family protein [Nocardia flavorosea]|uniref:Dienelactone hydrolase family protein n=1 Tax=Nocardia flavorosea TaxID=53429 RepID=A0A846YSW8_9NOCA|nr:dienelactone hydrolase family protein [Nocardia flavorosea]NKY60079.1 dienelactone hydrolase family protein [Nocardia flavorosea]
MTTSRTVTLQHEGADLAGVLVLPPGPGPHPAVLVAPTAVGLGAWIRERAELLARLGYAALAVDMYGGGRYFAEPRESGGDFAALQAAPGRIRARTMAWFRTLRELPEVDATRTVAIGYCFGGQCVLELARAGADVRAVVSFHGLLTTAQPAERDAVTSYVTVYAGGRDPYAPPEDIETLRREMAAAGAPCSVTVFSAAQHAFTDPGAGKVPGTGYDPVAAAVSWAGTVALLQEVLAGAQ